MARDDDRYYEREQERVRPRNRGDSDDSRNYGSPGGHGQQRGSSQPHRGGFAQGPQSYVGRGPKGWRRSDQRIEDDVCEQLERHPQVDASDIEVQVENGEVTLSGTVADRQSKRMTEDVAEAVFGVHDVHNRVKVRRAKDPGSEDDRDRDADRHARDNPTAPNATGTSGTASSASERSQNP